MSDSLIRRLRARGRGDRGSMSLELVVAFPVVLLIVFGGVQTALYYHARGVALAAAQEGLRDARVEGGSAVAGAQRASEFVAAAGGSDVLQGVRVVPVRSATQASITVQGTSLSVVPGWAGLPVSQTATGPVERLTVP